MFCHKCGTELEDKAQFCGHCGARTQGGFPADGKAGRRGSEGKAVSSKKKTNSFRILRVLVFLVLGLVLLAGAFFAYHKWQEAPLFTGSRDKDKEEKKEDRADKEDKDTDDAQGIGKKKGDKSRQKDSDKEEKSEEKKGDHDDMLGEAKARAEAVISDYTAGWPSGATVDEVTYLGTYVATANYRSVYDHNYLGIVYKIDSHVQASAEYPAVGVIQYYDVFFPYTDAKEDGRIEIDMDSYSTPNNSFNKRVYYGKGSSDYRNYNYSGYESLSAMVKHHADYISRQEPGEISSI